MRLAYWFQFRPSLALVWFFLASLIRSSIRLILCAYPVCVRARARCPREWPSSRPLVDARWASHPRSSSFLDGVENKTHFINEKTRPKKREECGKKTGQTEFAVDSREFLSLFWMSEWTTNVVLSFLRICRNLLPFLYLLFFLLFSK